MQDEKVIVKFGEFLCVKQDGAKHKQAVGACQLIDYNVLFVNIDCFGSKHPAFSKGVFQGLAVCYAAGTAY